MESKHKNALIGALLAVVFVMAVGYAAFAQQLTINGTAEITSTWDVKISKIEMTDSHSTGAAGAGDTTNPNAGANDVTTSSSSADYKGTTASFKALLVSPGDYVEYTVTVTNSGTIPASLESASWAATTPTYDASPIIYSTTGAPSAIAAGASQTFTVRVTYDTNITQQPATLTKEATYTMNYVQANS